MPKKTTAPYQEKERVFVPGIGWFWIGWYAPYGWGGTP
jgi:hypothetical protein